MNSDVYAREYYMEKIKKYAESSVVGNQAFLGLKGVGKTTLFQSYFTNQKRGELAQKYKKLFVFSRLDSRKQGYDLYKFLLDQVKIGIRGIPNEDVEHKQAIRSEMKEIDEIFETPDSRLTQYLTVIKEAGYDLIIVMDQFQCMARDTEIGKEQYDVLRSFNEDKLITYWIITDTDLIETRATKQYILSFFAQKFTSKLTIRPLDEQYRGEVVGYFDDQKKAGLTDEERSIVSEVSGGIPELMSILIGILCALKQEGKTVSTELLMDEAIVHSGCASLLEGWGSGLTLAQKKVLYDVAVSGNGLGKDGITTSESKMAELSDDVGRGLLHVYRENDEKIWRLSTKLLEKYILSQGEAYYRDPSEKSSAAQESPAEPGPTYNIVINGNYIQSQTNNVINIENAVAGLEDLQRLIYRNPVLLDESRVMDKLDCLPFKQKVWSEMKEDEREEELVKYADGVFASDVFSTSQLTPEQMRRFCLTEGLLGDISDSCQTQVVCGVQVYDLIQMCIDRFGLSMSESESPRGILFVRAFERHLKDFVAPAFCRIPQLASQHVYPTTKPFKDYPIDKTTIGTYSAILRNEYEIFVRACAQMPDHSDLDGSWWRQLSARLSRIGDLRNECCHSGTTFDNVKLKELIDRVFIRKAFGDVLIFREIHAPGGNRSASNQSGTMSYRVPDLSLIGSRVQFEILSKTARGNYKGTVNGAFEGSLPKSCTVGMDFVSVKNTTINAVADKVQDGKYVLKL